MTMKRETWQEQINNLLRTIACLQARVASLEHRWADVEKAKTYGKTHTSKLFEDGSEIVVQPVYRHETHAT